MGNFPGDTMEKTVKILIIVCIILVAGIGVTTGILIGKNSKVSDVQNDSAGNHSVQNTSHIQVNTTQSTSESKSIKTKSIYADSAKVYSKAQAWVKSNYPEGYTVSYPVLGELAPINNTYYSYYMEIDDDNGNYIRTLKASAYSGELFP